MDTKGSHPSKVINYCSEYEQYTKCNCFKLLPTLFCYVGCMFSGIYTIGYRSHLHERIHGMYDKGMLPPPVTLEPLFFFFQLTYTFSVDYFY